jgi:hypothetical protein
MNSPLQGQDAAFGPGALKPPPPKEAQSLKRNGEMNSPLQGQDAAFGLGAVKGRSYTYGLWRGCGALYRAWGGVPCRFGQNNGVARTAI